MWIYFHFHLFKNHEILVDRMFSLMTSIYFVITIFAVILNKIKEPLQRLPLKEKCFILRLMAEEQ